MAYPENRKEYMARMATMPPEEAASIVDIATPGGENVTEESFMASAPDYKRDMSFIQQPQPEPNALQQVGSYVADSALNKSLTAGMDKGTGMLKNWWGGLGKPVAVAGNPHIAAKMGAETMASQAAAPGVMGKLGAAASGAGSGMMAGLGALGPIGIGLGGLMLAKRFGLFNQGGAVGPLGAQHKQSGGEIPMYAGEGAYTFDPWASANTWVAPPNIFAINPRLGSDAWPLTPWEASGNMKRFPGRRSAGRRTWQPLNKGGEVQYKEDGGEAMPFMGPLGQQKTNPISTKVEKKETIEYKN